jgi:hypothetical protein
MRLLWSFLALTALTATALAQVDWTEQGDAGDLPETAQATGTDTSTPLSTISGALDANDVDMFAIYIADPSAFRAETNTTTTNFDSQLWLFDVNGNGIVHDDDSAGGLRSRITNANNCIPGPGIYYIAISRDPIDCEMRDAYPMSVDRQCEPIRCCRARSPHRCDLDDNGGTRATCPNARHHARQRCRCLCHLHQRPQHFQGRSRVRRVVDRQYLGGNTQPGRYYLAVSLFGRRAAGCSEGLIWATTPARSVRCPDGPESTSRVGGWSGSSSSTGRYIIFLTGVSGATARRRPRRLSAA